MGRESRPSQAGRTESGQLRARRSPRLLALGILCVVLGALGGAALYTNASQNTSVVMMTRDVTRGEAITAQDLAVVDLPGTTVNGAIPAERIDEFIGATALSDLPSGAFPAQRHLGQRPLPEGHSLVGLKLETGRIPGIPLAPGTQVRLVALGESQEITHAVVATSPFREEHETHFLLDVVVAQADAPRVAASAANNELVLVAEGDL